MPCARWPVDKDSFAECEKDVRISPSQKGFCKNCRKTDVKTKNESNIMLGT